MKRFIPFLIVLISVSHCYSQTLDQGIATVANTIAQKVSTKNKGKLALADFVNSDGKADALTKYIREQMEMNLINGDYNLQVMDRKHIAQLLAEHHLQSEGLIDEKTAKSSIEFIKVDGWITGEITYMGNQIKLTIKVIDITSSQIFAGCQNIMVNDSKINLCTICNGSGTTSVQASCSDCGGSGRITCKDCSGKRRFQCSQCSGTGKWGDIAPNRGIYDIPPCSQCSGKGYVLCSTCSGKGVAKCETCLGKGKVTTMQTCSKCNGTGRTSNSL